MRMVELGSVCEIKNGYAFKSSEFKKSGTPLIRISSFDNGPVYFDDKTVYVDSSYLKTKSGFRVEKGDVLIALSGATTGKYGIYTGDEPSLLNQRIGLLKSGASDQMTDKFFYYYLSVLKSEILRNAGGAAQPNISTKTISEFKIPLPPLDQQKKIAAILDAADTCRQKTKALIEKYDELTQSLFLEMFGDPVTNSRDYYFPKLKDVCKVSQGMQIAIKHRHKEFGPNRYKYLTVAYLNGRKDEEFIENPRASVVCSFEDILMTRTGSTGKVITNVEGVFHNNFFKVDWDRNKLNKIYFVAFLSHAKIRLELLKRASTTTIPDLNHGQFYDLNVIVPKKDLQNQFAERVQAIEAQKAQAQASLAQAEDLFNSLLQKAFKGELV